MKKKPIRDVVSTVQLFTEQTLDGKKVAYHSETEFLVQIGRYSKGSYSTRYVIVGNLAMAVGYYNGINIGNGYKKRLIAPSFNKPLLARAWS
jgi:hypothetical protein